MFKITEYNFKGYYYDDADAIASGLKTFFFSWTQIKNTKQAAKKKDKIFCLLHIQTKILFFFKFVFKECYD